MRIFLYIIGFLVIGIITITSISLLNFTNRTYQNKVKYFNDEVELNSTLITEDDLDGLPKAIKNYLLYVGVVGTEIPQKITVKMTGAMKLKVDDNFNDIVIDQTSYIESTTRLFYMEMKYRGIKIAGLHDFEAGEASMKIKMLDVFKIVDEDGTYMNQSETVTFLNDMFLLAPGSLLDSRLTYTEVDDYTVNVSFTENNITVTATVFFDEEGKMINFVSEDRYSLEDGENLLVTWRTPITEYTLMDNGLLLPSVGSAIWIHDDYEFEYIKLNIENVEYN